MRYKQKKEAIDLTLTLQPSNSVIDASNLIKISIIVLSFAAIPVVYNIPITQYGIYHTRQRFTYHDFTTEHLFPNLDSFVSMGSNRLLHKRKSGLNAESVNVFNPSMKILSRIMSVLMENNAVIKAALLKKANLNHIKLSAHLEWLEQKGLIEYIVVDDKANVTLTNTGREFAKPLVSLTV